MPSTIRLRFKLHHRLRLQPQVEMAPVFHVFLSASLSRRYHSCAAAGGSGSDAAEHCGSQALDLTFELERRPCDPELYPLGPCRATAELPLEERIFSAHLNVDAFARIANKKGELALNQCGSLRIGIADLLCAFAASGEKSFQVTVPSYGGVGQRISGRFVNDKGVCTLSPLDAETPVLELDGAPLTAEPNALAGVAAAVARVHGWKETV